MVVEQPLYHPFSNRPFPKSKTKFAKSSSLSKGKKRKEKKRYMRFPPIAPCGLRPKLVHANAKKKNTQEHRLPQEIRNMSDRIQHNFHLRPLQPGANGGVLRAA